MQDFSCNLLYNFFEIVKKNAIIKGPESNVTRYQAAL